MVFIIQHTIPLNKVEQVGHLLQIRGNIGIVARKMRIVELNVDDVANTPIGAERTTAAVVGLGSRKGEGHCPNQTKHSQQHSSSSAENGPPPDKSHPIHRVSSVS